MEKVNKKGLVFTLDAILSIIATLIILISVYSIFSNLNENDNDELHKIALDSLTVLEKNNALNLSVNNIDNVNNFLNALPNNVCANVSVYNNNEYIINSTIKNNCLINYNEKTIARRVFVSNYNVYFAKMEVSYV